MSFSPVHSREPMYSPEEGKVTEGLEAISGVWKEHARVRITGHVQPDGYAIGSGLAVECHAA